MKNKRIWIILPIVCILSGICFTVIGMMLGGIPGFYLDGTGVHSSRENVPYEPETFRQTTELEPFNCIDLKINYADVTFVPSDRYAVSYCLTGSMGAPVCQVENETLTFCENPLENDFRVYFFYTDPVSHQRNKEIPESFLKVEYPAGKDFSQITVGLDSGLLNLPPLNADTLQIKNEYGDVSLEGYNGTDLLLQMSGGCLTAGSVQADQAKLYNDYGDISLDTFTGKALDLHMSSGSLTLGAIEADQAELKNEYGSIFVRQGAGSRLDVYLDSGSFLADSLDFSSLNVKNEYAPVYLKLFGSLDDYTYNLYTDYGSIQIDGRHIEPEEEGSSEISYRSEGSSEKTVEIRCESGDIIIDPAQ
ncbi:MAG: DUF4097 domain-containing protein [Lachnospiraceae bacterium]|nr:DUF4097 domain-containing protein [Lachnospiraceae bacterium]